MIKEIGGLVGRSCVWVMIQHVVRGHFACMVVEFNLNEPLVPVVEPMVNI